MATTSRRSAFRSCSGRLLDERDRAGRTTSLINQAMAEKFWPGQDPIGKRFGQGTASRLKYVTVVGVVGNVRSFGLAARTPYEFYRSTDQMSFASMTVVIRTRDDRSDVADPERAADRGEHRSGASA